MAQKIAFATNKGGVTKTTSTVNVAGAIHRLKPEAKILIVDNDGQGSASRSFNINPKKIEDSIYDVYMGNKTAEEVIVKDVFDNIDIIPANPDMNFLEFDKMKDYEENFTAGTFELLKGLTENRVDINKLKIDDWKRLIPDNLSMTKNYFNLLDGKFDELDKEYDFILFDTPPEIKSITSSVLSIADYVIIPFEPDVYSVDGIMNIIDRIKVIHDNYNPNLQIGGILPVKVNDRTNLHNEVLNQMMRLANTKNIPFFSTYIPLTIKFASATAHKGLPATLSSRRNNKKDVLINSYFHLLDEMQQRGIIDLGRIG